MHSPHPQPESIDPRLLSITAINQKLRVDDTVSKYEKFVDAIRVFGLVDFEKDIWNNFEVR